MRAVAASAAGVLLTVAATATGCSGLQDGPGSTDPVWLAGPDLPQPVTNNAVAAVPTEAGMAVFSFLGLDSTKLWSGVTNAAYRWDAELGGGEWAGTWRPIEPVPGPGRLAATAQVVGGLVYVIGGYTVAEDGSERSVPDVNVYEPVTGTWRRGADIPVPSDDAVSGVWRDSLIVLVSGWHDTGNVDAVQLYDPASDRWSAATPIEGPSVFGHAGSVAGDAVVYVDGVTIVDATPRFVLDERSWRATIDPTAPATLAWEAVSPHPGPPLYRAASAAVPGYVLFVGGTDNPYNYSGIGYNGVPATPLRQAIAYDPVADRWHELTPPPDASMDHRTLGVAGGWVVLAGGMRRGQVVTDKVWLAPTDRLLPPGP